MDYAAHYSRLIERARSRALDGYHERHHVVPRCMGGGNEPVNIVNLTAEEHYVAHALLVKIHPKFTRLAIAFSVMSRRSGRNKVFGWMRRRFAVAVSVALTGRSLSEEHRANLSKSMVGRKFASPSKETLAKLSAVRLGRPRSEETRAKISESHKGIKHSQASREKMRVARNTPEYKARMAIASSGRKLSPESIAKRTLSRKMLADARAGGYL